MNTQQPPKEPQQQPPKDWRATSEETRATVEEAQRQLAKATELLNPEFNAELGIMRKMLGIGRRVIVPPDQIHAVRGYGITTYQKLPKDTAIFGKGDDGSVYWLNGLTQVIVLATKSFQVPLVNISALDSNRVSFNIDAYAIASLNPDSAAKAAEKIGGDPQGLVRLVTEVTSSELINAAAKMKLEEILEDRSKLVNSATAPIVQALTDLGYNLDVLRITKIRGEAVNLWEKRALAEVSYAATVKTNEAQVAEAENIAQRDEREAEIKATKEQKVAAESRSSRQAIAVGDHEFDLNQVGRDRKKAEEDNQLALRNAELAQEVAMVAVTNEAAKREVQMRRNADIRKEEQQLNANIALAAQQADDNKAQLAQQNSLQRDADRAQADADRHAQEEQAAANLRQKIKEVDANTEATAREISATAEATAVRIQATADAERTRTLATAEADAAAQEAKATASRADAEIKQANATRAKTAAEGLAQAEVAERNAEVAIKEADANRARGLADADVTRARAAAEAEGAHLMRQVEIDAQAALAEVYAASPVLVDLEKIRLQHAHEQNIAQLRLNAQIAMMQALAPQLNVNAKLIGNGTQMGSLLSQILTLSAGYEVLSEEVPVVNGLFRPNGDVNVGSIMRGTSDLLGGVLKDVNPRMFGALTLSSLVDRIIPVVEGEGDLQSFLIGLKEDASFNMVGNIPIAQLLGRAFTSMQTEKEQPSEGEVAQA